MSLNCNEINVIIDELNLNGSFIQEIVQPGYDTLSFKTINKGELKTLIICTSPQACRINQTFGKVPKNSKPLRFNEFLKKHIQGMRINDCYQLGLNRIIKMDVSTWQQRYYIYIRLWSGAANVIVTDEEGNILDCMYRRPAKGEISGGTFAPEIQQVTEAEKAVALQKFPIRNFDGVEGITADMTFNQKINHFYTEHATSLSREGLLEQAEKWYNVKHSKLSAALDKLESKKKDFENADKLKHIGDLILSYGSQSSGSILDCIDYETGQEVHIKLDPKKSIQENASIYYEQYKKANSGLEDLQHDIDITRRTIANLNNEYQSILKEKNVIKIEQMIRKDTTPKQKLEKPHPGLHYEINGWTLIVGRTANENDDLLRHYVKGQDLWLHTRDYAGGYVFVKARNGKTVPLDILLYAGNLAVYHSKARQNGQADLYYTQVKYLRRAKNGPKGLVLPTHEKNLLVKLDEQKLRTLDDLEKGVNII